MSTPKGNVAGTGELERVFRFGSLQLALVLSILSLIAQLCWPALNDWRRLPRAGSFGILRLAPNESSGSWELLDQCVVRLPSHYDKPGRRWPLVVFLHGSRERGTDIDRLIKYLKTRPFRFLADGEDGLPAILVAPLCLANSRWEPDSVAAIVHEIATKFRVDTNRIYLIGCSMGGYGVWHTAASYPDLFAAAVPICGGGDPESADALAQMPIWAFHGAKDDVIPLSESQQMIDAIEQGGGNPKFTILENDGHAVCNPACGRSDMWEWLFDQQQPGHERP